MTIQFLGRAIHWIYKLRAIAQGFTKSGVHDSVMELVGEELPLRSCLKKIIPCIKRVGMIWA